MKFIKSWILVQIICAVSFCQPVHAENNNYLLINLTSYTSPESHKAIEYAKAELRKGRPVIIYLNDASVLVAAKSNAQQFQKQQYNLNELIKKGAIVAACPHCMKRYGVAESELLPGIQVAEVSQE